MIRPLTPKVGTAVFSWIVTYSRNWGTQCAPQSKEGSPALGQREVAIKPRMSLVGGKGQAASEL